MKCAGCNRDAVENSRWCCVCSKNLVFSSYFKPNVTLSKHRTYYGIELETECHTDWEEYERTMQSLNKDWFYVKDDASLTYGLEIVSFPMTEWLIRLNKNNFKGILNRLVKGGARSYQTNTCGIHIHVSRRYVTPTMIYKIATLLQQNRLFIRRTAQRNLQNLQQWASIAPRHHYMGYLLGLEGMSRYHAMAVREETIEFRLFRGTLNYESFMKNFEFVVGILEWSRQTSLQDVSIKSFVSYIMAEKSSKFDNLKNFWLSKEWFDVDY